ncbi:MAG: hypothetical protein Q4E60_03730 [Bacteroidales bacterium]|nr:hypothetical protein [Bacteroidales bacterium]
MPGNHEQIVLSLIRDAIKDTPFENHVFLVGGAVRDELMGFAIKDIDLCVDIPNGGIELAEWITLQLNGKHTKLNPLRFPAYGIGKFYLKSYPEVKVECAQTRKEIYNNPESRNPITTFANISEDCFRRDLTINALYKNISTDEVLDFTRWGLPDLKNHIIRTPREPFITFNEDALRELRVIRFASRFQWQIEAGTLKGIADNAQRLETITQDRITEEIGKILLTPKPSLGLSLLRDCGLLQYTIKEIDKITISIWQNQLNLIDNCLPELECRLAALFSSTNDEKLVLQRLNFPVTTIKRAVEIKKLYLELNTAPAPVIEPEIRRWQMRCGGNWDAVLSLLHTTNLATTTHLQEKTVCMIQEGSACFEMKLPLNGQDIIKHFNLKPGPAIKMLLEKAQGLYFENPFITKDECLNLLQHELD